MMLSSISNEQIDQLSAEFRNALAAAGIDYFGRASVGALLAVTMAIADFHAAGETGTLTVEFESGQCVGWKLDSENPALCWPPKRMMTAGMHEG